MAASMLFGTLVLRAHELATELADWIKLIGRRLKIWVDACAATSVAAALYR